MSTMLPNGGWFDLLGTYPDDVAIENAVRLLISSGCNPGEARLTLAVVCREIEHDNPDRAQRILRSYVDKDETLVMRTLATLCGDGVSA